MVNRDLQEVGVDSKGEKGDSEETTRATMGRQCEGVGDAKGLRWVLSSRHT